MGGCAYFFIVTLINSHFSRFFLSPSAGVAAPWQSLRTTFLRCSCDVKMSSGDTPAISCHMHKQIWDLGKSPSKKRLLLNRLNLQKTSLQNEWNPHGMLRLKKVPGAVSTGTWMRIFPMQRRDAWSQAQTGDFRLSFGFLKMSMMSR